MGCPPGLSFSQGVIENRGRTIEIRRRLLCKKATFFHEAACHFLPEVVIFENPPSI
jgi:hypothetical protein